MIGAVLGGPDLNSFDNFAHPFGMVLYHVFTFIVIVILLNILIALYNQAYTDIMENAEEEFMALVRMSHPRKAVLTDLIVLAQDHSVRTGTR